MSLLTELKRRNVFRVAAFYLVSAWLVLQVADVLFGVLRLPDWTLSFVAALLALGFVPVCVFSWVYEITPEGVKKESDIDRSQSIAPHTGKRLDRLIIIGLVAVVGVLLVERFWSGAPAPVESPGEQAHETASDQEDETQTDDLSVAVLPFANMSSDAENEYFADGLTEELLNALTQVDRLKVAGRTSSFYFKGRNEDLKSIGRQLGVAHVVEGSVRKAGDRVRITAQLVKVDDGFHLWSDTYDRDLADIFQVQEEISRAIAEAMKLELGLEMDPSPTDDLVAYERYLEARARIASRTGLDRAIGMLEEVVGRDPDFAEAWAALGQAYALGHYYAVGTIESNRGHVERATDRALALKPDLAIALTARADMLRDGGQWREAETHYRASLAKRPDSVETNSQYAQFLGRAGFTEEGLPYARKTRDLDPLAPVNHALYGASLTLLGQYQEAEPVLHRSLELNPEFDLAHAFLFRLLAAQGRFEEARPHLMARVRLVGASEDYIRTTGEAFDLTRRGDRDAAMVQVERSLTLIQQEDEAKRWILADPLAALANLNGDLEFQEKVYQAVSIFQWMPDLAPVRQADWWRRSVEESGLVEFWRVRGWPPHCRALDASQFECD